MLELEQISPDAVILWQWGPFYINATLLFTWVVMAGLTIACLVASARMRGIDQPSRWQCFLEMVVDYMRRQIREVVAEQPDSYLPFIGGLFLFIGFANLLMIVPGYVSPIGSLSTTTALAGMVFFAVPIYGIAGRGVAGYLAKYVKPSVLMLPFHIISELSRTLALAVRLFGNVMSGTKVAGLLVAIAPLFFPIVMQALGLLTGLIQAYIFAVLALIYIGSASRAHEPSEDRARREAEGGA
jgi:F-type H+-transporting ATPase subunit a